MTCGKTFSSADIMRLILPLMLALLFIKAGAITTTPAGRILGQDTAPSDSMSVAPMADCKGAMIDVGEQIRRCYLDCEGPPEPVEGSTIGIHQTEVEGPMVVECLKVRLTQTFTQTWTFSTIKSEMSRVVLQADIDECKKELSKRCPTYNCRSREPDTLDEEYHYGSTTTKSRDMILLYSSKSALFYNEGQQHISPAGAQSSFLAADKKGIKDKLVFLWDEDVEITSCPYRLVGEYGCDRFKDSEEDFYSCNGGRIAVTPRKGNPDVLSSLCPGLKLSEEGFMYTMTKGEAKSSKTGRLSINVMSSAAESEDTSYLRHKIQQMAKKLDSDICINQCEILSLEARVSNQTRKLVRSGLDSYLILPNGTAQYCNPLHGCKLPSKIVYCGNPSRISIICSGVTRYWNPLLPFTEPGGECYKPDQVERLTFTMGSTHYEVDAGLKVKVPNHQYHHKYANEFLRYHNSRLNMRVQDLNELKEGWTAAKGENVIPYEEGKDSTTIDAPHISIGSKIVGTMTGIFSSIKTIEAVVGVFVMMGAVGLTVSLINKIFPSTATKRYGDYTNVLQSLPFGSNKYEPTQQSSNIVWA
ncbi:glycoprotein [Chrysanthemum yellow dwarf virus]|uniref:Glycoprotein n=1 Tax=chrysanthemum yellow dwarf associated virus TaxID=3070829 RepID=A0AAE7UFE5_9RHAB|nr:glycoprotein [Chrysanthemum yellow dwarf virus]QRX38980.1 glycoprotein [Chrysanthemum yellow dwarf virus]